VSTCRSLDDAEQHDLLTHQDQNRAHEARYGTPDFDFNDSAHRMATDAAYTLTRRKKSSFLHHRGTPPLPGNELCMRSQQKMTMSLTPKRFRRFPHRILAIKVAPSIIDEIVKCNFIMSFRLSL
jgi:hypothetical protein